MRKVIYVVVILITSVMSGITYGDTVVNMIGDIDGFQGGDPADVPPRSQTLLDAFASFGATPFDMDIQSENTPGKGFTHMFSIPAGQIITSATLTVGMYWERSNAHISDALMLDDTVRGLANGSILWSPSMPRMRIQDVLGYIPGFGTTEVIMDLSSVPVRPFSEATPVNQNFISELLDGEFDVIVGEDSNADYSILSIETIPEPTTLSLLSFSALTLLRRKRT